MTYHFSLLVGCEREAGVWLVHWISVAILTPLSALFLAVLEPP